MTFKRIAFAMALLISAASMAPLARAQSSEPTIYFFGAADCEYCANGLAFLSRWKDADARILLDVFDIVKKSEDATAFVQIVGAIGLADPRVPMTVVGNHVFVGYESDATTGAEIKAAVEQCRVSVCADVVRGILTLGADVATAAGGWTVNQRFAKAVIVK